MVNVWIIKVLRQVAAIIVMTLVWSSTFCNIYLIISGQNIFDVAETPLMKEIGLCH